MVDNYIKTLLHSHECVVIPDFGGFIAERISVDIHPITHRFNPPSKRIAFNEQLKVNDGLLSTTIAYNEGISMEEALKKIKDFIALVREELRISKSYSFSEIGKLYYNIENRLEFEPEKKINFLDDSFGLTELFFKPINITLTDMSTPQRPVRPVVRRPVQSGQQTSSTEDPKEKKETGGLRVFLIILPLLLLLGAAGAIVYYKQGGKSMAGMNPFGTSKEISPKETVSDISNSDSLAIDDSLTTISDIVDSSVSDVPADITAEENSNVLLSVDENPAKQTLIDRQNKLKEESATNKKQEEEALNGTTAQHGRYFVIVGSFISKENAYKFRNKIASIGPNTTIIEPTPDKKFYKVAIDDFDSKDAALRKKNELSSEFGSSVWVMSY